MFQARILELLVLAPLVAMRSVPKGGSHHSSRQELLRSPKWSPAQARSRERMRQRLARSKSSMREPATRNESHPSRSWEAIQ